ncbi:MAG: PTS sugar transporter subunit IIA [Pseudomonadota bacterium]|jgi:PTS system nitrogen regulatory IIA component
MTATSNLIAGLVPDSNVLLGCDLGSKKRVFERIGLLVENHHGIGRSTVFDSLFARERLGSTGLGQGVAIPHGRIKGLREAIGVFVRMGAPIAFDAPDGAPVNLIFALLVPERATDLHLEILAQLAELFSDRDMRQQLAAATDVAVLRSLLEQWSPDATAQRSPTV